MVIARYINGKLVSEEVLRDCCAAAKRIKSVRRKTKSVNNATRKVRHS